jgi:hypothetical protein
MSDKDYSKLVTITNYKELHDYILNSTTKELGELVTDCYYPKIASIYRELLHRTKADEKELIKYSKQKYNNPKWKLLHDPFTTLAIILIKISLEQKDYISALSVFNLMSIRTYTNTMHTFIKYCNSTYFKSALNMLAKSHLFNLKHTIPSSIIYLSNQLFQKYKTDIEIDNIPQIIKMVMEIRTRFFQSVRSFAEKYYKVSKDGEGLIKSEEEKDYVQSYEKDLQKIISDTARNITVYGHIDSEVLDLTQKLTKFNKDLSSKYIYALNNPSFTNSIIDALYLLLKPMNDFSIMQKSDYLDYIKNLMSVKVSKQPVYFKKIITEIHNNIISKLKLEKWYNNLSVQSQALSRSFIAYYLALYIKNFIFTK